MIFMLTRRESWKESPLVPFSEKDLIQRKLKTRQQMNKFNEVKMKQSNSFDFIENISQTRHQMFKTDLFGFKNPNKRDLDIVQRNDIL